jgi:hypothetical protein
MPKFLYCTECNCGFELDNALKTCKTACDNDCGNVRGKYRPDGEIADVCAKNPENARFVGIRCNREKIMKEILQLDQNMIDEILIDEIFAAIRCLSEQNEVPRMKDLFKKNPRLMIEIAPSLGFLCNAKICSNELSSAIRNTKEWKQYERHKKEFRAIQSPEDWQSWEKDHIAHDQDRWVCCRDDKGYVVGFVESIAKTDWHDSWKYCDSLCEKEFLL